MNNVDINYRSNCPSVENYATVAGWDIGSIDFQHGTPSHLQLIQQHPQLLIIGLKISNYLVRCHFFQLYLQELVLLNMVSSHSLNFYNHL